jgi:tetratricopeptide (TPR) repeat protein
VSAEERPGRRFRVAAAAILGLAAGLRAAHLAAVADRPFVAQLALDSQEYDRWAREILAGDLLGSAPFFQAPLYPYVVALLYALFGATPTVVYLAQIAAAVAGAAALVAVGLRLGGPPVALAAGALHAVYAPLVFYDVQLLKESFATTLAAVLLLALVAARERDRGAAWLAAGVVAGLLALLRENMLLAAPFLLPLAFRRGAPWRSSLGRALLLVAGVALPLLPVAARNAALGGGFLPTTSQGGVNFWIGNNPRADGTYRPLVPGKQIPRYEREEARRLAERAAGRTLAADEVSAHWLGAALAWAREHPGDFLRLAGRKVGLYLSGYEWPDAVDFYWMKTVSPPLRLAFVEFGAVLPLAAVGLLLVLVDRARRRSYLPVLLFELAWLATTVAFFLFSRYRLPAVPGLLLLAALPLAALASAWRAGRRRFAVVGFALTAFLLAVPHLADYRPRADLVEFNLGRLAEERGDAAAAERHYEAALDADPDAYSPTLDLGNLAARRGDYEAARSLYARAVAIAPDADDAHANLGGALLALGDLAGARRELGRALALNPENRFARHNLGLLEARGDAP